MKLFQGLYTALISPFCKDKLDEEGFLNLLQTQSDVDGVVVGGTTGESPTITEDELNRLIQLTVQNFRGKIIVGAGSNNTLSAIKKIKNLDTIKGINGYLIAAPYYNKPNQRGIFEHFSNIADSTERSIVLYNIPGRCGVEIAVDTVIALQKKHKNIVAIKEATDNCARVDDMYRCLPDHFSILSGNDNMTLPFMAQGAVGVISASSNVLVREIKQMVCDALRGDFCLARDMHRKCLPLMRLLFEEPNPIVIKHILAKRDIICSSEVRLPLYASSCEKLKEIEKSFS